MKKKNKRAHARKKKEFRYHAIKVQALEKKTKIWHPTYVFLLIGNVYKYVTITHSKVVNGKVFIELRKNPNPKDKRKSYRSKDIFIDTKDNFGKPRKGWILDPDDEKELREQNKNDDSAD